MFADDTKLYHTIKSESDCNILQQHLRNGGSIWLTNFNLHESKVLSFGTHGQVNKEYSYILPHVLVMMIINWMELRRRLTWMYYLTLL